jgi:hypothetical protein
MLCSSPAKQFESNTKTVPHGKLCDHELDDVKPYGATTMCAMTSIPQLVLPSADFTRVSRFQMGVETRVVTLLILGVVLPVFCLQVAGCMYWHEQEES